MIFFHLKHSLLAFTKGAFAGFFVVALACGGIVALYKYAHRAISPDIQKLLANPAPESSKIYAQDGTLLYEVFSDYKRTPVPLSKISLAAQYATIAIEDKSFYEHKGVYVPSLIRSALSNVYEGEVSYGGSTITQQLVKNAVLTREKSLIRKFAEVIWALEIEQRWNKEQILEAYLNQIPYGRTSAGIEAASLAYFGKHADQVSIAESAYLASLPQAPSLYDPFGPNRETLDGRKNYVIDQMLEQGYINQAQHDSAQQEVVAFKPQATTELKSPHFVLWVRQTLLDSYGDEYVYRGGLKVHTTLDQNLQEQGQHIIQEWLTKNGRRYGAYNASLVAIDPKTGFVKAMVGSRDYYGKPYPGNCSPGKNCLFEPEVNVATSWRQPGSSFKPYVYLTAFGEQFKYTPASIVQDVARDFNSGPGVYRPLNYNGHQYGPVPIRKALAGSLNIATVDLASKIGTDAIIDTTRKLGHTAPFKDCGLALALGGCEVTLLEHTAAFSVFANGGKRNPATGISKILDRDGQTIYEAIPKNEPAINPQAVYELTSVMTDNDARTYIFGKDSPLILPDRKVAAKTGTTQNWKDGWTMGFTPSLTVGVWVGNNDGTLLRSGADGVFTAAPIWHDFMQTALAGTPAEEFEVPTGITQVAINPRTGLIAQGNPRGAKQEVFADYAVPQYEAKMPEPTPKPQPKVASEQIDLSGDDTVIVYPRSTDVIKQHPFDVMVYTGSSTVGVTVELFIDDQLIASKTEAPFLFTIPHMLKNGQHTITAKANHFGAYESTDSVKVMTQFNPPPAVPRGDIPKRPDAPGGE